MDKYDYHFISIKFLTAILLALIFAFLLVYVFTPEKRESYPVYSLEREGIKEVSQINILNREEQSLLRTVSSEQREFEAGLRARSFQLMEASRDALLAVISSNYLEKLNGLREEKMSALEERRAELKIREEQLLQQKRKELENDLVEMGQTGSQNNINSTIVRNVEALFPPLDEQKAIAKILRDMDTEIQTLESKRAKYEQIKQGMMQELLTGKTRLVG